MLFCCKNAKNGASHNAGQTLTHTVTHTRNYPDRSKEYRRGSFCFLSGIFASFFCSHHLRHEATHFLRGLLLHLPSDVGVGAEGESRVVVTEH